MTSDNPKRANATAVLAIAGLLGFVGQSHGQQNSLVFPWQAQDRGPSAYISRGATVAPWAPPFYSSANVDNSRAFYPSSLDAEKVMMNVTVPANASIIVQGAKTTQSGEYRRFLSPLIAAGYQYSYSVQASWMENGREVTQSRTFAVHPGAVVNITFTRDAVTVRSEN